MSTQPGNAAIDHDAGAAAERRTLRRVLMLGVPLALVLWCALPNIGPVFRFFTIPATSMAPTLPLGSTVAVSRVSYGYSRYSFDTFALPIAGRIPAAVPARGDVVVFRLPHDHATFYIKRVIGLPGDKVQMQEGQLLINGKLVERVAAEKMRDPSGDKGDVASYIERLPEGASYRIIETEGDSGFYDNTKEIQVPAGQLFMMGDNRDNSNDSRVPDNLSGFGTVPVELVLGRIVATF